MPRFKLSPHDRSLTDEQALELRIWFYSARTVEAKCKELGISRHTLYDYINRKHKSPAHKIQSSHVRLCAD